MVRNRKIAGGLGALFALVLLSPVLTASAQAQGEGNGNGNGGEAAAEHRRIVDYWTPARRASATPREKVRPAPNGKPGGPPTTTTTTSPSGTTVTGAPWTGGGAVVKTTGKVFFNLGTSRYTCSGSAVAAPQGNVVLTAGHCLHDKDLGFATNWIFYPGYSNGSPNATLGSWTATALFTTGSWASAEDFDDDAGFAVVRENSSDDMFAGRLGTLPGITFSSTNTSAHYAFGYPAAKRYSGGTLIYCAGTVRIGAYDGANTVSMGCDMTGGSSGGPWFQSFSTSTGTGSIRSLTSYGYQSLKNVLFGPVLDGPEQAAYDAANAGSCEPETLTCVAYSG